MKSQWHCIQQNIGTWQGSFTQFSPEGEQLKDTPSVLTLKESEPGKKMQLTLERFPGKASRQNVSSAIDGSPEMDGSPEITQREFSAPGPAPYVYFFESGAFSQGSSQWAAFGQFGAEMSIKVGDRRVRFVIMYEATSDGTSTVKYVTLIRETLLIYDNQMGGTPFGEPMLTIEQLMGDWIGTAQVLHATMSPMSEGESIWQLNDDLKMTCQEQFDETVQTLFGVQGTQEKKQIILKEDNEGLMYQLMLLPNGAYCLIPQIILKNKAFRLEVGWLPDCSDQLPLTRSRLIRYYDNRGIWTDSALIEDQPKTQS
jgi:Domain of unknown function (DUF3598)